MSRKASLERAAADYRRGLSFIDEAFDRARRDDQLVLPCGRGCSSCCAAVFDVQPADALLLQTWIREQDAGVRDEVETRATAVLAAVRRAAEHLLKAGDPAFQGWDPRAEGLQALPAEAVTRLAAATEAPCPLLGEEGECRAHASRPALCRLQGLPWRDPRTGAELPDFCRLDPAMERNPAQALDFARLDGLRHETDEAIRRASGGESVAPRRSFVAAVLAPPQEP